MSDRATVVASESATSLASSANPLDLLTLRQLFVYTAHAHGRSMTEVAEVLDVARQVVYEHLDRALERLKPAPSRRPPGLEPSPAAPDAAVPSYSCGKHYLRCPADCPQLVAFVRDFDRAYPTEA